MVFFFVMIPRPPRSTRTDTLFPYTTLFRSILFFAPNYLGHSDNYIPANPLSTPAHIVPAWYFWPFYAILRAFTFHFLWIPAKLWGVLAMRSEEQPSELQSLMRNSYAVLCLTKKMQYIQTYNHRTTLLH